MLRTALGPAIAEFLEDPMTVEVMLNPDGRLWIDRLSEGLSDTGATLSPADGERIVRLVAHHVGAEVHAARTRVSAELPETGERFEGLLPPVVTAPCFAIRKPAVAVFTLADYVASGIMTETQAALLREGVATRANILVAGGTSTGKTTLTNALLAEVAGSSDRVVIIEDDRHGEARAVEAASAGYRPSDPQIAWHLARFIEEVRGLPADPIVVRQNWLRAYEFTTDRGALALNDHARANDPFTRVGEDQVSVEVSSVIRASPDSFRVAWSERHYENGQLARTERWTAILTIVVDPPRTADRLRANPLGIYVNAINWSREMSQ
nr:conjugal transfer protein TrbF [Rhodovulum imhoffii]